ncbi:MAG: SUMF1/EgtB/PvdO family nonheme iron enzyme [Bacteroidota bacterium]
MSPLTHVGSLVIAALLASLPAVTPTDSVKLDSVKPGHAEPGHTESDYTEVVEGVPFVMKAIPAGSFQQGCGEADEPCAEEEWVDHAADVRQRTVPVRAFYLAETETTWALYQRCIDAGACPDNTADGGDNGWGKGTRPAIEVSWDDVSTAFLPWLNRATGRAYRLPTEAEWAYAARAGATTRYAWGDEPDCSKARYGFVSDDCGRPTSTVPVKSYPPNAFGLYDMHGNVWEYVADCWQPGYGETRAVPSTPFGAEACREYVLRGGSWLNAPHNVRAAARFRHDRTYRESGDGFRLAHDVD